MVSEDTRHPEDRAGLISRLTFWWVQPFIRRGATGESLTNDDLWPVTRVDDADHVCKLYDDAYEKLRKEKGANPTVIRALWETFGTHFMVSGLLKLINDILVFANPVLMQQLLKYISNQERDLATGLTIAAAFFIANSIQSIAMNQYWHRTQRLGIWLRATQILKLFQKCMDTSNATQLQPDFHKGRLVTMMSNDAQRLQDCTFFLHLVWSAPLQFLTACIMLYMGLGWPSLVGVGLMAALIPVNTRVMRNMIKYSRDKVKFTDDRVKSIDECLQGIRIVKVMAWEELFTQKLIGLREKEIGTLKKQHNLRLLSFSIMNLTPIVVAAAVFTLYAILPGRELDATVIFPCMALLNIIRFPLMMMPALQSSLAETAVSVRRIQSYLESPKRIRYAAELTAAERSAGLAAVIQNGTFHWYEGQTADGTPATAAGKPLKWYTKLLKKVKREKKGPGPAPTASAEMKITEKVVLKDINLQIKKGGLVFVIGETGAGKSSLLAALMGHIESSVPDCRVAYSGSVAYVAQDAWIMNTTVEKNITFQCEFDRTRYKKAVEVCQLQADLNQLAAGDQTEIGEKGINLSGGQKQRVALARAMYADCDLYLMDDPLSAVDAHVGKALFDHCICDSLKSKTRVLVTHQVQFLERADQIIVVANNTVTFNGTYQEMQESGTMLESLEMAGGTPNEAAPEPEQAAAPAAPGPGPTGPAEDGEPAPKARRASREPKVKAVKAKKVKGAAKGADSDEDGAGLLAGDELIEVDGDSSDSDSDEDEPLPGPDDVRKSMDGADTKGTRAKSKAGTLMTVEEKKEGRVNTKVYLDYIAAGGGLSNFGFVVLMFALFETCKVGGDVWLSVWSTNKFEWEKWSYIGLYLVIVLSAASINFGRGFVLYAFIREASKKLHLNMLVAVLKAPLAFFDTTPHGRVLNRFTKDIDSIDSTLAASINFGINLLFSTTSAMLVIIGAQPSAIVAMVLLGYIYSVILRYFIPTFRDTKRLDSINKSPIFAHYSETLNGITTIMAYDGEASFQRENAARLNLNTRSNFAFLCAQRWLGVRLEAMGNFLVSMIALAAVLLKMYASQPDTGLLGLSIVYAVNLTASLGFMVRQVADIEAQMNGVERVMEYTHDIPQEQPKLLSTAPEPPAGWPAAGNIRFERVQLRYQEHLPLVLKGSTFDVKGPEKVGIVGRTGSGKSTTLSALFRLVELAGGRILIDDIDISTVNLQTLRSALTIIPQDPVLFHGTVRSNLDPFNQATDQQIWDALRKTKMCARISEEPLKLEAPVTEGGSNFSVGQRQLLCLTRAILKDAKILCLDEATASVDRDTDKMIQETIRTAFAHCTVLTIAHRLRTIMDYDKVVVMDDGSVAEYGTPLQLLEHKGILHDMCASHGPQEYERLRAIAAGDGSFTPSPPASPLPLKP
mmetsp:Transcript_133973/g.232584  ORF Transcript_133973/g.232584 Transcript_133973/m.232584 type:complete len:1411 (-) Transcript_133973:84-4316(-)